jgi:hypothetical protein
MQRIFYQFLFFNLILLSLFSCNSDKNANDSLSDDNQNTADPLSEFEFSLEANADSAAYIQKSIQKEVAPVDPKAEEQTQIRIKYPYIQAFKNETVKDSVNAIILELLLLNTADEIAYESLEDRLESFIREYEMAKEEMENELVLPSSWTCEVSIDVVLNTEKILALRFFEMNYTGGVHPNSFTRYFNFNMQTGELIELEDILTEDYRKELVKTAEVYFKKAMEIAPETPISSTPYEFPGGKFLLPRNFAIGKTGLIFCYNPYDIGPYSMGTIEFEVPYDGIIKLLKKEVLK